MFRRSDLNQLAGKLALISESQISWLQAKANCLSQSALVRNRSTCRERAASSFDEPVGSSRCGQRSAYLAQLHRKISNQRRNAAHQLSRRLVNNYEFIAVEDLETSKMVSGPGFNLEPRASHYVRAIVKSRLNRSIYDAGWGILLSMLLYKAESAGRVVVAVDAHYTSQRCAICGHISARNRVNQALFRCIACGHEDHADVNAACNILWAGRAQQATACRGRAKAATLYPLADTTARDFAVS